MLVSSVVKSMMLTCGGLQSFKNELEDPCTGFDGLGHNFGPLDAVYRSTLLSYCNTELQSYQHVPLHSASFELVPGLICSIETVHNSHIVQGSQYMAEAELMLICRKEAMSTALFQVLGNKCTLLLMLLSSSSTQAL